MAEKILIIDDDLDTLKLVGMMLQKQGYQILAATTGEQGLTQAENEDPDLILLDVMMPGMDGYEVARRLRANSDTASTPILMFTAKTQLDDKVTGFEAGADDYLTKPTHPSELVAHVKALLARSSKGKTTTAGAVTAERRSFTVGVLAARGGLGVTTVAANLGSALQAVTQTEVIMVELRPGQGTLGPDLGHPDPRALIDLLQANQSDLSRQRVRDALVQHESGLQLLFGSTQPKDALLLNAISQFETLFNRLVYLTPYLVIDLGSGLPPLTQKLINTCSQVAVVIEPLPHSVEHAKAMLADLVELGIERRCLHPVVVNRIRTELQMNWTKVQEQLGYPVAGAITPAPELMYMAARTKTTAVVHQPGSLTGQQFAKLANHLLEVQKSQG
ncbi:MAG: response regulator [Anaerolineales bacterium]|nr:response regulator [Anaerolineales bacterium]